MYTGVGYNRPISLLAYPTIGYASSDINLACITVGYARLISLLAYPTVGYASSETELVYTAFGNIGSMPGVQGSWVCHYASSVCTQPLVTLALI